MLACPWLDTRASSLYTCSELFLPNPLLFEDYNVRSQKVVTLRWCSSARYLYSLRSWITNFQCVVVRAPFINAHCLYETGVFSTTPIYSLDFVKITPPVIHSILCPWVIFPDPRVETTENSRHGAAGGSSMAAHPHTQASSFKLNP